MIRILIVNQHKLMCNIIASALEDETDLSVAGYATSVDDALAFVQENAVDLILIGLRMGGQGALKLTQALSELAPEKNLVIFGLPEDKDKVLPFVEAGADGYVRKQDSVSDLLSTIRLAYKDEARLSPDITYALMNRIAKLKEIKGELDPALVEKAELTPRELEVLECLGNNLTNKEIADHLIIEVGTVKNHVHNILEKLNVSSRGQAAEYLLYINK